MQDNPEKFVVLEHENGIKLDDSVKRVFGDVVEHDPRDWLGAMKFARDEEKLPLGLLYWDPDAVVYEDISAKDTGKSDEEKIAAINAAMDAFAI